MKILNKFFTAVLVLGFVLSIPFETYAAQVTEVRPYTYTVRFLSGNHGTFADGSDAYVHSGIQAGDSVQFTAQNAVKLDADSKYYVKGVRLAGRDNSEAELAQLTVKVNKDEDYVVVYGIKGNQVSYTVNYVDTDGKKLADSDVFYGNIGDKPVIAYKYIEGYVPQVYGFTKTLSENEADNVFTFVYDESASGVSGGGGTTIVYVDKVITVITGGGGAGAGGGTAGQESTEGEGSGEASGEVEEPSGGSQEIVDLDDEETPLGNIDLDEKPGESGPSMTSILSLVGISILALIVLIIVALKMRDRMKNN